MTDTAVARRDFAFVRSRLMNREEIAFLDVREEAPHAEGHPLFAANLPLSRIELDAWTVLPRRSVPVVTFDAGEGLAERAAQRLLAMGYTDVAVFDGGLAAWKAAGGEVFIDVNVPSKAFGELVESVCHTPSLSAEEVKALIDAGEDMVVVDVRRFDEYHTMSIPTGISVPGAELVLRVPDLAPDPATRVVVNCAGRTRSLIGTQSLINAGLPNPVTALRNGTIGWTLASQQLEFGQSRRHGETDATSRREAAQRARAVADRTGVGRVNKATALAWLDDPSRTTYCLDVRSPEEYEAGHVAGFRHKAGGQLVQETEMAAPVRGARIVLADDDGARANMCASWLAQMAWEVYVVDDLAADDFTDTGPWQPPLPPVPAAATIDVDELAAMADKAVVVDLARHAVYRKGHLPGALYLRRSAIDVDAARLPAATVYVLTSDDGVMARYAAPELAAQVAGEVRVLAGGTAAWIAAGKPLEAGETHLVSAPIDRYRRPYEGTEAPREAMEAYLQWEYGLVEQLGRDGSHHFAPLAGD